jgi:hypothetical protein
MLPSDIEFHAILMPGVATVPADFMRAPEPAATGKLEIPRRVPLASSPVIEKRRAPQYGRLLRVRQALPVMNRSATATLKGACTAGALEVGEGNLAQFSCVEHIEMNVASQSTGKENQRETELHQPLWV